MDKAVFILGAGASAPFGVPTLLNVFKDHSARAYLNENEFLRTRLACLFWRPRGHTLDTSNETLSVEEILTLVRDFEKPAYAFAPPMLPEDGESDRFKRDLFVLIKKAVYDHKNTQAGYLNPIIGHARANIEQSTWATFNWDCIFEASYYYSGGSHPFDRCNPRVVVDLQNWYSGSQRCTYLKLHGGINWWYENNSLHYLPFGSQPALNEKWAAYQHGETGGQPVILEPSYYKYSDPVYELLRSQWDYFVQRLLDAELVVIIGYSLPEADEEARRALSIGFQSNRNARYLVIDPMEWVCGRYKRLFGTSRLRTIQKPIEEVYEELPDLIEGRQ